MGKTQRGITTALWMAFEDDYNDGPAAPDVSSVFNLTYIRESVNAPRAKNQSAAMSGRRDPVKPFDGNQDVSGDVEVPVDDTQFGLLLKGFYGSPQTTDNGDGTFTHVWVVSNASLPSFLLEKRWTDLDTPAFFRATGIKPDTMSMNVGGDGELTAVFSVAGADGLLSGASFAAGASSIYGTPFKHFHAALLEGGAALATGQVLEMNLGNNLDRDTFVLDGTGVRGGLDEGIMAISGRLRMLFKDTTVLAKAVNGTESSLKLTFTNPVNSHALCFEFQEVEYERNVPGTEGPQGLRVELPWQAFFNDGANNSAVKVSLTNARAAY
jgi:hypothetical protein